MIKLKMTTQNQREILDILPKHIVTSLDVLVKAKNKLNDENIDIYASRCGMPYNQYDRKEISNNYFLCSKEDVINSIKNEKNCIGLHEVIKEDDRTKVYIDYENVNDDYSDLVIRELKNKFGQECIFNMTSSCREFENGYKYSYHITIENRHLDNDTERKAFKNYLENTKVLINIGTENEKLKTLCEIGCDKSVYNKNNLLRCVNNYKYEKEYDGKNYKPKKINNSLKCITENANQEVKAHLVKEIRDDSVNIYHLIENVKIIDKTTYNKKSVTDFFKNKIEESSKVDILRHTCEFEKLKKYENDLCEVFRCEEFGDDRFKVWDWALSKNIREYYYLLGRPFEEYWNLRKLKCDYKKQDEKVKYEIHLNEWQKMLKTAKTEMLRDKCEKFILDRISLFIPNYEKNITDVFYKNNLTIEETKDIKRIELEHTDIAECKLSVLNLPMGTGKTRGLVEWIYKNNIKSCIVITSMTNLLSNFQDADYKHIFTHYKNVKDGENPDLLLCCINSLCNFELKKYICVIFDEPELLLNNHLIKDDKTGRPSMYSKKLGKDVIGDVINKLECIILMADKLFLLDALASTTTIEWVKEICNIYNIDKGDKEENYKSYEIIKTSVIRPKKEACFVSSVVSQGKLIPKHETAFIKLHSLAIECLKAGKKIFIYIPYVNTTKGGTLVCCKTQMEVIKMYIEAGCNFLIGYEKKCGCGSKITKGCDECLKQLEEEKFILHNSKSNKDKLTDVNKYWGHGKKLVIVNNSVCAGSSYTNKDDVFDYVFIFVNTFMATSGIIAQVMGRVRYYNEKMFICVTENNRTQKSFEVYDYMKHPKLFKHFYNCFLQQKASNNIENLKFTIKLANYDIKDIVITDINQSVSMNGELINGNNEIVEQEGKYKETSNLEMYLFQNVILNDDDINYINDDTELNNLEISIKYDKIFFCKLFGSSVKICDKSLMIRDLYNEQAFKKLTKFLLRNDKLEKHKKMMNFITFEKNAIVNGYEDLNDFDLNIFFKILQNTHKVVICPKKLLTAYVIKNTKFLTDGEINIIKKQLIRTEKTRSVKSSVVACEYINKKSGCFTFCYDGKVSGYKFLVDIKTFFDTFNKTMSELKQLEHLEQLNDDKTQTYSFIDED